MYTNRLSTFIIVAQEKSFTKAAKKLYMTTTAVVKQINSLEKELDCPLFIRNNHGVKLTKEGQIIYDEGRYIIDYCDNVVNNIHISMNKEYCLSIGTSLLCPHTPINKYWTYIQQYYPNYKLRIIPFNDETKNANVQVSKNIGSQFDFVISECDSYRYLSKYNFCLLGYYDLCVTLPNTHHLAHKEFLTFEDLFGETLVMCKKGDSSVIDLLRQDIVDHYPEIKIENTNYYYDLNTFNRCAIENQILVSAECWKDVHPLLKNIPVKWNYQMPYGILYSKKPSNEVKQIIELIKTIKEANYE